MNCSSNLKYSDQGKYSKAEIHVIRQLCNLFRVKKTRTTPLFNYLQGNCQCERFDRTLHVLLRSLPPAKIIKAISKTFIFFLSNIYILISCLLVHVQYRQTWRLDIYDIYRIYNIMTTGDHNGTKHGCHSIILE